jgi:6-pyruvoyltetrahydropterin/6-carboxytetrahydropterin synthase
MKVELTKQMVFEAAHETKEHGLHGHSYLLELVVEGEMGEDTGWLIDYGDIKAAAQPIYSQLDHNLLNRIEGLEGVDISTLQSWICNRLKPQLPELKSVRLTIQGDLVFRPVIENDIPGLDLPERLSFTFEACHSLTRVGSGHPCKNMHGHSYQVQVAPVEERLEPLLHEIYELLDHCHLNDVEGLENTTSEKLARWLWVRLKPQYEKLSLIIVNETRTARCIYRGR